MKNQPKHCAFPSTIKDRATSALDFTNIAPQQGASDLFSVMLSNAETAFQEIHEWEYGKEYDTKDIIQAACAMFPCFVSENHTYNLGYRVQDIPREDYEAWNEAKAKRDNPMRDYSVEELNLPRLVINTLLKHNLKTVNDVLENHDKLIYMHGIGISTLVKIYYALVELTMQFPQDENLFMKTALINHEILKHAQ